MSQFEASQIISNFELAQIARDLASSLHLNVSEGHYVPPVYETARARGIGSQLVIGNNIPKSRLNLTAKDGRIRITLQADRFGITWVRQKDHSYPRFEALETQFFEAFEKFQESVTVFKGVTLKVSQAEIQYVNLVEDMSGDGLKKFNFINMNGFRDYEGVQFSTSQRLSDVSPIGRLYLEAQSEFMMDLVTPTEAREVRVLKVFLTFRGEPTNHLGDGLSDFFRRGREAIVTTFSQSLTASGRRAWGEKERDNG